MYRYDGVWRNFSLCFESSINVYITCIKGFEFLLILKAFPLAAKRSLEPKWKDGIQALWLQDNGGCSLRVIIPCIPIAIIIVPGEVLTLTRREATEPSEHKYGEDWR